MKRSYVLAAVAALAAVGAVALWRGGVSERGPTTATATPGATPAPDMAAEMVAVTMPPIAAGPEQRGQAAFAARCAECHGPNAGGIDGVGPPLVHKFYEPNHHGDMAFEIAAAQGVRAHHWRFGDMPPVAGVTRAEVNDIIAFVRRVQRENGIF